MDKLKALLFHKQISTFDCIKCLKKQYQSFLLVSKRGKGLKASPSYIDIFHVYFFFTDRKMDRKEN